MYSFRLISVIAITSAVSIAFAQEPARQEAVKLNVMVTDHKGQLVKGLQKEDFRLREEGKQQEITYFSDDDLPIRYGILIDFTGSMRRNVSQAIDVARMIIQKNRPEDEAFLARLVGDKLEMSADWTSDRKKLLAALQQPSQPAGNTALFSALWSCLDYIGHRDAKENSSQYRRALILITDGLEHNSKHTFTQLIDRLRMQDVQIFVMGFVLSSGTTQLFERDLNNKAYENLYYIARETGGRVFFPDSDDERRKTAELISDSLRSQYIVGYASNLKVDKNSYRKVKVTVSDDASRKKRSVLVRSGYWIK